MPTVHRAHGLRFVIYLNDHSPAHVHAIGADGEAKIVLGSEGEAPTLDWVKGLTATDVRRAMTEVGAEQTRLWEAWKRIHEGG